MIAWSGRKTHSWESEKKHIVTEITMAYLYDFYCTMHTLISDESNIECELFIFEYFEIIQLTTHPLMKRNMISYFVLIF